MVKRKTHRNGNHARHAKKQRMCFATVWGSRFCFFSDGATLWGNRVIVVIKPPTLGEISLSGKKTWEQKAATHQGKTRGVLLRIAALLSQ